MNRFHGPADDTVLTTISLMFGRNIPSISPATGNIPSGLAVQVVVWSDPNGDGNPNDAVPLSFQLHNIVNFNNNVTFDDVPVTPLYLVSGQSIFVGAYIENAPDASFIASIDDSNPGNNSWVSFNGDATPIDLSNLSSVGFFNTNQSLGYGAYMVRATFESVPEPSVWMLAGIAALGTMLRRRRNGTE